VRAPSKAKLSLVAWISRRDSTLSALCRHHRPRFPKPRDEQQVRHVAHPCSSSSATIWACALGLVQEPAPFQDPDPGNGPPRVRFSGVFRRWLSLRNYRCHDRKNFFHPPAVPSAPVAGIGSRGLRFACARRHRIPAHEAGRSPALESAPVAIVILRCSPSRAQARPLWTHITGRLHLTRNVRRWPEPWSCRRPAVGGVVTRASIG